jgi:outer membrane protein
MKRLVVAALLALGAVPLYGQQEPPIPAQLTLEEAIALARRNNPQHLQVLNNVDVASAQVRQNFATFLPNLRFGTSTGSSWTRRLTTTGNFGEPLAQPEPITSETSNAGYSLSTEITLFDGGKMFADLGAARAGVQVADAEIAGGENTLRANVARAYFAAVRADRLVTLEEQLLAFGEEQVRITDEQFRVAAAQQTDVLGAQGDVAAKRRSLAAAQASARKARLDVLEQLGVRGEERFDLVTELPAVVDPQQLDVEALVARALTSSPAVLTAVARARQADKQASASHGSRWPSVTLGGQYGRSSSERGLFDAWGRFDHNNQGASLNLSVSLPLFDRFQTSASVAQAEAAADDAHHTEQQQRILAEKEVRSALIDLGNAHESLLLAQEQARLAELRVELAQEQYRAGVSTMNFTNLQQIIQLNEQAQRQALEARFAYQNALILLEEKLGGPVNPGN